MKRLSLFGAAAAFLLAATTASAHHAFSAQFDESKPVTLRGILTKMEMTNPHGWIHMDVKSPEGKIVNCAIETNNSNALVRAGLRKTDFVPGSEIIVQGFLAKNGTPTLNGRSVKFADGRDFFLGTPGALGGGAPAP